MWIERGSEEDMIKDEEEREGRKVGFNSKVTRPNLVTHCKRTPTFECCVIRCR